MLFGYLEHRNLTPLDYYLWGAIKDKCYADKPETIDVLRDNIREVNDEFLIAWFLYNAVGTNRVIGGLPVNSCG